MKINLVLNSPDLRAGFITVDPFARPGDGKVPCSLSHLDNLLDDAEAAEIIATDVLDFFGPRDKEDVLDHWIRKLHHGASITIGGLDLRVVARLLTLHRIDIDRANILIYGDQQEPWKSRKGTISLPLLMDQIKRRGLKVLTATYMEGFYSLTARRP